MQASAAPTPFFSELAGGVAKGLLGAAQMTATTVTGIAKATGDATKAVTDTVVDTTQHVAKGVVDGVANTFDAFVGKPAKKVAQQGSQLASNTLHGAGDFVTQVAKPLV